MKNYYLRLVFVKADNLKPIRYLRLIKNKIRGRCFKGCPYCGFTLGEEGPYTNMKCGNCGELMNVTPFGVE